MRGNLIINIRVGTESVKHIPYFSFLISEGIYLLLMII